MSVTVLSVSDGELRRLEVLRDVDHGGLPVRAAAQLLGRSDRQVWRLLKAFRSDGAAGLISKKRGRPSNRKTPAAVRAAAMVSIRSKTAGSSCPRRRWFTPRRVGCTVSSPIPRAS